VSGASVTALVPMKGHSERVPNKNLRVLHDRPMFHYAIEALLEAGPIDRVIVNTDSEAIAAAATARFGEQVLIHWRPDEICGDFVSMNTIIRHDLEHAPGEVFLQTHSTNPFLTTATIEAAVARFLDSGPHDSLFAVTALHARCYDREGRPINHNPEEMLRTQDLPPVLLENSNLYLFSRASFLQTGRRIGAHPLLFEMDKLEAIDIDDEADFRLAEALARDRARGRS
jgi:CMP-N-acetylneuraminic acid synthetase